MSKESSSKAELEPHETDLVGDWLFHEGQMRRDPTDERIYVLVENYLERIADSWDGWATLYRDPKDGRYWEATYPHSEMHGGGPARLSFIDLDEARARYGEPAKPD